MKRTPLFLLIPVLALAGCELLVDFDRTKIPSDVADSSVIIPGNDGSFEESDATLPEADAGDADAASGDAGGSDGSAVEDGGNVDAGASDAGETDAGTGDAGDAG